MGKKKTYTVVCGKERKKYKFEDNYTFQNVNVFFAFSENAFKACIKMDSTSDLETFMKSPRFYDLLAKAYIVHFIYFSKELKIEELKITIDSEAKTFPYVEKPLLFSLLENEPVSKMPLAFRNFDFIHKILNTSKNNYDSRFSSLFAFMISKTKKYEPERFFNLWIAMNGLYGFYAKLIVEGMNFSKEKDKEDDTPSKISCENKQIQCFQFFNNFGNDSITKKARNRICGSMKNLLKTIPAKCLQSKSEFDESEYKARLEKILSDANISVSCYGFLLLHFAYDLRCATFHANKPQPLLYIREKHGWKIYEFINKLLEEYLNDNLYKFFIPDFISAERQRIEVTGKMHDSIFIVDSIDKI